MKSEFFAKILRTSLSFSEVGWILTGEPVSRARIGFKPVKFF
jgi:hypothetical protein